MSTASEEILGRYAKGETVADDLGRLITVRRLRPSQQVAIMRIAGTADENVVGVMTAAASVSKIDDLIYPFPKTQNDIDSMMDRLDAEGLAAATKAFLKMTGQLVEPSPETAPKTGDAPAS